MTSPVLHFEWDPNKARTNLTKHGVAFETAATVLQDALALTVYDEAHSEFEERWFTIGRASNGTLLVVVHTYESLSATEARVRLISAREATPRERRSYEDEPR
ncbi:BrnT family toxin [Pelomonas sp. P7]|uniref:BrnT family toxin n=1 Tax=Pelomonas caseinilytica TaxID=2906763 RepID=A0ABS8XI70_9BURK|nr:BrnT family toxin [Pelomonas sp. P7]MCE4538236.1 BrnT family toxin [Pelomonas sp. P7]